MVAGPSHVIQHIMTRSARIAREWKGPNSMTMQMAINFVRTKITTGMTYAWELMDLTPKQLKRFAKIERNAIVAIVYGLQVAMRSNCAAASFDGSRTEALSSSSSSS